ncbi:MAG: hypothetical protein M1282_00465 [Chloroflexi bacterium]|nr:hypothetical protein [Chloroflexota bacterium]
MHKFLFSGRKKTLPWLISVTACFVIAFAGFEFLRSYFPPAASAPGKFPDANIVFNAGWKLGFINADGSGVTIIPFRLTTSSMEVWGQPRITGDNKTLIVINSLYPVGIGNIFVTHVGGNALNCSQWGTSSIQLAGDQQHILIDTQQGLAEYLPSDCGTNRAPIKLYNGIYGVLSPNEQYSANIEWAGENPNQPMIVIREIGSDNSRKIGPGDFPAWSRDSQWLAYTGADGIYIINIKSNSEAKRVVALQNTDPDKGSKYPLYLEDSSPSVYFPPMVSWSPDGQWLVYHLHRAEAGRDSRGDPSFYSLFKVNIITGEETKLIDGGLSPYWRWQAQP